MTDAISVHGGTTGDNVVIAGSDQGYYVRQAVGKAFECLRRRRISRAAPPPPASYTTSGDTTR